MTYEIYVLSWIGALLLSVCAVPQAIKAHLDPPSTEGLSWWFLWTWLLGEIFMMVGLSQAVSWPVMANYVFNVALIWYLMSVKKRVES